MVSFLKYIIIFILLSKVTTSFVPKLCFSFYIIIYHWFGKKFGKKEKKKELIVPCKPLNSQLGWREGEGKCGHGPLNFSKILPTLVFLVKTVIILDINLKNDPLNFY